MAAQRVIGGDTFGFVSLLPAAVATGGVVTLQRMVGTLNVAFGVAPSPNITSGQLAQRLNPLGLSVQLLATRQGVITAEMLLDPLDNADKDSTNFLWRRMYSQGASLGPAYLASAGEDFAVHPDRDFDIKTKRTFDRSQWSLVLAFRVPTADIAEWLISYEFRGLFLTSGGI